MIQIPFAKPPLEELRFRKPVPIDPWQGVYNATQFSSSCHQKKVNCEHNDTESLLQCMASKKQYPISEDCLYLNLWVPKKFTNVTVMIWIYGGAYTSGSSNLDIYNGLTLAARNDVIVASMNYRLGALGFLYLGTEEAPGNMGLYDQALAIQWIKDNIQFFGGNPDSITIFGESAGAASISAHLLSPVSRHLMKRVILQSGVVNAPWSYATAEKSKELSLTLAKKIGCSSVTSRNNHLILQCLKNNIEKLYATAGLSFTPTVSL